MIRKDLYFSVFALVVLTITGCAGGQLLERPKADAANYAEILNHTLDTRAKIYVGLHSYPYADVNLVWPNWSNENGPDVRSYSDRSNIYATEGWFHIVYACPNVIYVDSYGNETIVHLRAGHVYKLVCAVDAEYGSLDDQNP